MSPKLYHCNYTILNRLFTYCIGFFLLLTSFFAACNNTQGDTENRKEKKEVTLVLKDIRGKEITYDFYEVKKGNDLEYVATEVADSDGETTVLLKVDFSVNNLIVKRTKNGVEKRQVVPIRSSKMEVQFLL